MFRFAAPAWLLLAPAMLAVAWLLARRRRRGDARLRLPGAVQLLRLGRSPWQRLEGILPWIRGLVLLLLVAGLARPQAGSRIETVSTYGVDIVLALDVSPSMRAEDFRPQNRLAVAKQTVEQFIGARPSDRIGLVVFAAQAVTRCPLTQDHAMLRQFLEAVDFAPEEQGSTAIGMGLAAAANRLRRSDARSKVVVLITDGRNNSGQIGPQAAIEAARALSIKVYTIGVGTEGEVPVPRDYGALGVRYTMQRVDLDEESLTEIATKTGGQYFRARDAAGLQRGLETIDTLEQTEIESHVRVLYTELFAYALVPGLLLLGLERILGGTRLRRIP